MVKPRVVIVGGGFGGLTAAASIARSAVSVTVIDRKNYHTFQPLLYQVATAGLSPGEIAAPIRGVLHRYKNVSVLMAEVCGFDLETRRVKLSDSQIDYDYLIVAAGASHSYFGHDEWAAAAPGLKTIEDALEMRRRVLLAFELAERQAVITGAHQPLNFVIIGAGPTGVELAGTLAEVARHSLARDFRAIDPRLTRIILVEGESRVLPAYPDELSRSARQQLEQGQPAAVPRAAAEVAAGALEELAPRHLLGGEPQFHQRLLRGNVPLLAPALWPWFRTEWTSR